jgi:hypothetical protein
MKNCLKTLQLTPSLAEAALRVFHFIGTRQLLSRR